jgi:hypothetical protein
VKKWPNNFVREACQKKSENEEGEEEEGEGEGGEKRREDLRE